MGVDLNLIATVATPIVVAIGGGIVTYMRSMAQSLKGIEIHVAMLATRIEIIEGNMSDERHVPM